MATFDLDKGTRLYQDRRSRDTRSEAGLSLSAAEEKARRIVEKRYGKEYTEENIKLNKKMQEDLLKLTKKYAKTTLKEKMKAAEEAAQYEIDTANTTNEKIQASFKKTAISFKNALASTGEALVNFGKRSLSSIDNYISSYGEYMSSINTRLQGADKDYNSLMRTISGKVGGSPYVSQQNLINNLQSLVKQGINYNVELRAFLMTVSDRIATTFNVADGTLLRLIRIQQSDSTSARLGLESTLNKFLNQKFKDTSYMDSLSKTVSNAILEANATLTKEQSVGFEYQTQKWLGSLSSVGVSDSFISSLAQGIGYLGSGNLSALSGNTQLQNLLAMAASRAGLDYSGMLTGGMSEKDVNTLLKSVVEYGQEIFKSGNRVVQSAYASAFGMSMSDLYSLINLSSSDIATIANQMLDYSGAVKETTNMLASIGDRMTLKDKINNSISNILSTVGQSIASNAVSYVSWQLGNLMSSSGVDPEISLGFLGSGTSLKSSAIAKTAALAIGGVSNIATILGAVSSIGKELNLTDWNEDNLRTTRGDYISTVGGHTISQSTMVGNLEGTSLASVQREPTYIEGKESEVKNILESGMADVATISRLMEEVNMTLKDLNNKIGVGG